MPVSFARFDRLKSEGVAAYQNGDYLAAGQATGITLGATGEGWQDARAIEEVIEGQLEWSAMLKRLTKP